MLIQGPCSDPYQVDPYSPLSLALMQGSIAVLGEKLDACCDWIRLLSDKTLIDRCGGSLTGFSVDAPTHARTINFHDSLDLGCHLERGIEQTCAAIFNLVRLKKIYEEREREREYIYIYLSLSLSIFLHIHIHTSMPIYIYTHCIYTCLQADAAG